MYDIHRHYSYFIDMQPFGDKTSETGTFYNKNPFK